MLRSNAIFAVLVLGSVVRPGSSMALTTPPAGGPGIVDSGKSGVDEAPVRAGVSSKEWFLALSRVPVSREKQDLITPLVRTFRFQEKVWKADVEPGYRKMLADYRDAEPENRLELLPEIKAVRATRPKFLNVKAAVLQLLGPVQKNTLLKQVNKEKRRSDGLIGRANDARRTGNEAGPVDDKAENSKKAENRRDLTKAWRFMDDSEAERHVDPAAPVKTDVPSSESSEGG